MASHEMVLEENSDDTGNHSSSNNHNDCDTEEKVVMNGDDNDNTNKENNNNNYENNNENNNNEDNNNNDNNSGNNNNESGFLFPDRATRAIKENHGCFIKSLEICPFEGSTNLVATAGSNQVSLYDCTHRNNFFDLVSHYYNFPNVESKRIAITDDTDAPNPKATYKQSKVKFELDECDTVSFNDITWMQRKQDHDLLIAAACSDGNIHIISIVWSKCILVFPASKYGIEQITTHPQYSSNVIVSVDANNVTKFWDIDSIDKSKLEYDHNGFILNNTITPCLLEINDDLQCIAFEPTDAHNDNNGNNNNTHLFYGVSKNGYLKSYLIDCNPRNDENEGKNESENEDELDMMMSLDDENNNKNKSEAIKWSYNVILNDKIKYSANSNRGIKPVSMRWRPGKNYQNQILIVDMDARFILYNISTKQVLQNFEIKGGMTLFDESTDLPQYSFDFSKNGRFIVFGNDNGMTYIYDLAKSRYCKKLKVSKLRTTAAVFHSRFAEPNEESVIVVGESIIWKYDRTQWVERYHDTSAFFQYPTPFSQLQKSIVTYVDF